MKVIIKPLLFLCLCSGCWFSTAYSDDKQSNAVQLEAVLSMNADMDYGEYLAGECLTCHLAAGSGDSIPVIHGKEKAYLANAILEYQQKQRDNSVMQNVTAALSNEEIAALIGYFAAH